MFSSLMMNTWIAVNIVAVIAGVTGFFAVLRGQSSAAHAIPNGAVSVAVIAVMYRPLLLASALPAAADARGVSTRRMELCFLIVMALATSMTVPVVGALLMFALMIGPAAAVRSFTRRPGHAIAVAAGIALVTRLGRHRALLPHQLAARLLRRRDRRRVLPARPGLGRCPPARVRTPPAARAQCCPMIPNGSVVLDRAARGPNGRRDLVIGELGAAGFQAGDEAGDQVPGVGPRGADAVQEGGVVHLAGLCPAEQVRRYC